MRVSGGPQSFNTINQLRVLGRWMRLITIPNRYSVAKAFVEFDKTNRIKPSSFYDRIVNVMEELVKFTLLNRDSAYYLCQGLALRQTHREMATNHLPQNVTIRFYSS
jgi:arsenic resistance protein ArsH